MKSTLRNLTYILLGGALLAGMPPSAPARSRRSHRTAKPAKKATPPASGAENLTPNLTLNQYSTVEIAPNLPTDYENPFDPAQITVTGVFTSPRGSVRQAPGFFSREYTRALQDNKEVLTPAGTPGWKVRFTPDTVGLWKYRVFARDKNGLKALSGSFEVKPSTSKGFIRRSPRSRQYLRYDNGSPYFVIGENMGWPSGRGLYDYEDWVPALSKAGGNWFRVWIVHHDPFGLEWTAPPPGGGAQGDFKGLGRYALDSAWRIDRLLELAKKNNVAVMLTLGTFGDLKDEPDYFGARNWDRNPYNAKNGGPANTPAEFFTNPQAKANYKQYLRYMVARYAHSPAVQAWEFWNEVNAPADWVAEMSQYLRDLDPYDHLISTSYGDDAVWKIPQIDFTQSHNYGTGSSLLDSGPVIANLNRDLTAKYGKPHLVAEFGIDWQKSDRDHDPKGTGVNFHNGLWASAMSGGMGGAGLWYWDNYVHALDLYHEFTPLARFAAKVPWPEREWKPLQSDPPRIAGAANTYTDVTVPASFGWGKPDGDAVYTVLPNGLVQGGMTPQYLYSTAKADLRTTPQFKVSFTQPGRFLVRVQDVMTAGRLKIDVDGKTELEQDLPAGKGEGPWKSSAFQQQYNTYLATYDREYGVDVPAGEHTIRVENAGGDWILVSGYRLTNYRPSSYPPIRLIGQQSGRRAVLWLQDEASNWKEAAAGTEPKEWPGVSVKVTGLPVGAYRVYWWDTRRGSVIRSSFVRAAIDGLTLPVPTFRRDIAADIQGGA